MSDVQQPDIVGPSLLELPKPTNRAWRERAITRAAEIMMMLGWFKSQDVEGGIKQKYLDEGIQGHVLEAIRAATAYSRLRPWPSAAIIERVMSHLDAPENEVKTLELIGSGAGPEVAVIKEEQTVSPDPAAQPSTGAATSAPSQSHAGTDSATQSPTAEPGG
jgi:hypothetical protein